MTSLLPRPSVRPAVAPTDARHQRPLLLVGLLGGVAAAASTLLVCMAVGVVGWFLSDAGAHGTPRDGLRVGALGWLVGHGSGIHAGGASVTVVPLGVTAVCAAVIWRLAHRVGDSVSGHGPDADGIADGQRDWTVPLATGAFTLGYGVVAATAVRLAADASTAPSGLRLVLWVVALCGTLGLAGIAVGSGRAAIWAALLPPSVRASCAACLRIVGGFLAVSVLVFAVALVADFGTAVNVMSQLHTDAGEAAVYTALTATVVPNAAVFAGSYLLGPGFAVGVHTVVSPTMVSTGALPMFPLLAALPANGSAPVWAPYLLALAPLTAAVAAARSQRRHRTLRWEEGALRGCAGGMLAGVLFGLLAAVSGGAAGPGRMQEVGPSGVDVLVHAITAFGIGGLVGGVAMTWWQRRAARRSS